jgi:hypothetical protein
MRSAAREVVPVRWVFIGECVSLGLGPRKPIFELTNARWLFEEDVPILGRPTVRAWLQHRQDACFVARQEVEDSRRRLHGCLKQQVAGIYLDVDAGVTSDLEGLCRAHGRVPAFASQFTQSVDNGSGARPSIIIHHCTFGKPAELRPGRRHNLHHILGGKALLAPNF